jgi:hypothetical protein
MRGAQRLRKTDFCLYRLGAMSFRASAFVFSEPQGPTSVGGAGHLFAAAGVTGVACEKN